jgi:hypothetical protein
MAAVALVLVVRAATNDGIRPGARVYIPKNAHP